MAQRSIGLSIQILNIEELTKFENRINELNKKGIKLNVTGLDKLDNIQNLINNIDKVKTQLDTIAKSGILNQGQIKYDNQQIDETVKKLQQVKDAKGNLSKTSTVAIDGETVKNVEEYSQVIGRTMSIIKDMKKNSETTVITLNTDKMTSTALNIEKAVKSAELAMDGLKAKNKEVYDSLKGSQSMIDYGNSIEQLKKMQSELSKGIIKKGDEANTFKTLTENLNTLKYSVSSIKQSFSQGVIDEKNIQKEQAEIDKLNNKLSDLIGKFNLMKNEDIFINKGVSAIFDGEKEKNGLLNQANSMFKKIDTSNLEEAKKLVDELSAKYSLMEKNSKRILNFKPLVDQYKSLNKQLGEDFVSKIAKNNGIDKSALDISQYTTLLNNLTKNSDKINDVKFTKLTNNLKELLSAIQKDEKSINSYIEKIKTDFNKLDKSQLNNSFIKRLENQVNSLDVSTPIEKLTDLSNKIKELSNNSKQSVKIETSLDKSNTSFQNLRNQYGTILDEKQLEREVAKYEEAKNKLTEMKKEIAKGVKYDDSEVTKNVNKLSDAYTNLKNQVISVNKSIQQNENAFDNSIQGLISKIKGSFAKLLNQETNLDSSFVSKLQQQVNSLDVNSKAEEIKALNNLINSLLGNSAKISSIKNTIATKENEFNYLMGNMSSSQLGSSKVMTEVENYKSAIRELKSLQDQLAKGEINSANAKSSVSEATNRATISLRNLRRETGQTLNTQKSFLSSLKSLGNSMGIYMSLAIVMRRVYMSIREGISNVIDLEDSMVSLQRVYNITGQSVQDFQNKLVSTSRELGTSATDYIDAVTSFKKLGYDINEAQNLATQTTKFNLAGDINNMEQATSSVVSVLKGFKLEAKDVTNVVDAMNTASNEYAVSASDLADIMQKSSSSLSVYGNSLNESLALGTVANEIMQDSSKVGRAFNTKRGMVA